LVKKRNHYIPQFLLRRFASREEHGRHWLWQFRSGKRPVEIVTKDAAVATFFYGQPATGVEDSFAELEGQQAALLRDLDAGTSPDGRSQELERFVWSLAFRTRALRGQFSGVAERGIAQMGVVDDKTITDAFGRAITNNFDRYLDDFLSKLPAGQQLAIKHLLQLPGVSEAVRDHVRREVGMTVPMVRTLLEQAAKVMPNAAESGQIQAFTKFFAEGKAVPDTFKVPIWSIEQFSPKSVVLGDIVLFATGPDANCGAVGRFTKDFVAIYFPISHESVLVGRRDEASPVLGLAGINAASAQLSLDTFFASKRTDMELGLVPQIGSGEPILPEDELRRIVGGAWNSLGKP